MKKKQISKKAAFLLFNLLAQTHPDPTHVEWIQDPNKNLAIQESELLELGLIKDVNGELLPTQAGIEYFNGNSCPDVEQLIQRLKNVIPKNPSFEHMAQSLSDTALMGAIYALFGEVGRRGDPDNPEKYAYFNQKCRDMEVVLKDADPNSLWVRHCKAKEAFAA